MNFNLGKFILISAFISSFTALAYSAPAHSRSEIHVNKASYGKTDDGQNVDLYTITNSQGMEVRAITYGGIIVSLRVPDKTGKSENVVLGFDNLDGYVHHNKPYFGAIIGRYGNRIANGQFSLDGVEYHLAKNNGSNSLHGGLRGFNAVVWEGTALDNGIRLTYISKDGEEGYPGNLKTTVTYTLNNKNELAISYEATTDKASPINLTQHSYFNLAGAKSGDVLDHELLIAADKYTPTDATLIPTGEIKSVRGTPLDFTKPRRIGERLDQLKDSPGGGYDHNFVLDNGGKDEPGFAARVSEPKTGRILEMYTTEPGVQLYTGNFLDGKLIGRGGVVYKKHAGFCLEAQHFPDAVHHDHFPSIILKPGETYRQTTIYKFSAK